MPFLLYLLVLAGAFALAVTTQESKALRHPLYLRSTPKGPPPGLFSSEFDLLDIVLVASVDGKFHALNRSSGHTLWSMSSFATTTSVAAPAALAPLVRTPFVDDDMDDHETYIIEPQSGQIYVLSDPASPLKRFPFSVQELVDMSPFTSSNGEQTRVFVGRKETSLLLIELATGRIKATLNSECPPEWEDEKIAGIDLDDLESEHDAISTPTQVYVGRIDYHISIFKKPPAGQSASPPQKLLFSAYGPNNRDNHLQAIYRRTKDDSYIQSLTNGEVISFRTKIDGTEGGQPMWGRHFAAPVVAVFDILRTNPRSLKQPFVLLQPRPRLQDLFPELSLGNSPHSVLPNFGSAYVGLLEESGSLFAMSPERYPLVLFGCNERESERFIGQNGDDNGGPNGMKTLDPPRKKGYRPDGNDEDEPVTFGGPNESSDTYDEDSLLDTCLVNPHYPRCLVGVRPIEDDGGYEGRMKRLLEGPKPVVQQHTESESDFPEEQGSVVIEDGRHVDDNSSGFYRDLNEGLGLIDAGSSRPTARMWSTWFASDMGGGTFWEMVVLSLGLGVPSLWFVWKGLRRGIGEVLQGTKKKQEISLKNRPIPKGESMPLVSFDQNGTIAEEFVSKPNDSGSSISSSGKELPPLPLSDPPDLPPLEEGMPAPSSTLPDTPIPEYAEDTEDETEATGIVATHGKKRVRRGKRGKKKKVAVAGTPADNGNEGEQEKEDGATEKASLVLITSPKNATVQQPSLLVSDTILGFGSHGTVVFQGSLQGRSVAVKRLLRDFVTLADREVSILQDSDDHPNVIRYYYQEARENFLYIALELCPASLADVIENPNQDHWRDIAISFDPKKALKQISSGMRHLHGLKLVHRDIKPQNILISAIKGSGSNNFKGRGSVGYRMLISDFGLCKRLDVDQTSFLPTAYGALAAGTVGWRAPEILRGEVKLDEGLTSEDRGSMSSRGSVGTVTGSSSGSVGSSANNKPHARLTKSVDIFSLGCLFYYTLTNGGHPYGDRFEREVNILKDAKDLSGVERFGEEGTEAKDLITRMLNPYPTQRPDTTICLLHPYFWDAGRRLNFLQDASDRFEIMCRDPKDPNLLALEKGAASVVGNDWHTRLDKVFIENLGKYRKYDGKSLQDLLRALRNKKHHYQDLPENVKRHLGLVPEGFLAYFTKRYPQLFLHVHTIIKETGLHSEPMFRSYFELPDS